MGSYYVCHQDDYRLSELGNLKESSSNTQSNTQGATQSSNQNSTQSSIFENNLCFTNIKRGLGFPVDEISSNSTDGTDDWTTRARASPMVERLIFQELQSDVMDYANTIGVSMDPMQWVVSDTQKWLQWVANFYHIGDLTNCLSYDGPTLCGFTEEDFILLTKSKDVGPRIAAQLDIWKNVTKMTPSASSYHFQQQQAMDQKLGIMGTPNQNTSGAPKLLDQDCGWQAPTPQFSAASQAALAQFGTFPNSIGQNFPTSRGNSFQTYNLNDPQMGYSTDMPQARPTPRPTIPLDRFRSFREAVQDNGTIPWEKYQEFTGMTTNRNLPNLVFPQTTAKPNIPLQGTSSSSFHMDIVEPKEEPVQPAATAMPPSLQESELNPNINTNIEPDYSEVDLLELKTEPQSAATGSGSAEMPMDTLEPEPKVSTEKPAKKKSSKHPIHLWEFLKQLLHDGKDCIRWIDQEKGIFKIYNSQEVAKYWGERKNRPAMNYDKLSRSIRQYYKKGIIKKTSQGKRLVYQFCEGYL